MAFHSRAPRRAPTVPADDPGWSPRRRFLMSVLGETQLREPNDESSPVEALARRAQVVRWSRILFRAAFAFFLIGMMGVVILDAVLPAGRTFMTVWLLVAVAVIAGVGVALHGQRTVWGLHPRPVPLPATSAVEQRRQAEADDYSVGLSSRVGVAGYLVGITLLLVLVPDSGLVTAVGLVLALILAVSLGGWISKLARAEYQDVLARQTPRLVIPNLVERAQAVQEAMEEVARLNEELQDEVRVQQGVLGEIQRQVVDHQRTAAISKAEAESVARVLDVYQERGRRRSFWGGLAVNLAVAVISGFFFFLLAVYVNNESLHESLHRWSPFG
jgi:hypothetical protein